MSLHVFANFVTPFGTAANNRAETEGNITTLQKLLWQGETHSTVSAEAIRFALRRRLNDAEKNGTNRRWDEDARNNTWKDGDFKGWDSNDGDTYIDDDLLGFMTAEAAKGDASDIENAEISETKGKKKGAGKEKGTANVRRAVLEVTRAVSTTSWAGDVTFNAASQPGTAREFSPWLLLAMAAVGAVCYQAEVRAVHLLWRWCG